MASDVRPSKRQLLSEDEFENYDVFISHRGPDTKTGFVGFLCDKIESVGLRPFLDCVSIDKGQDSWTCIEHAIKTSPIAVVIFSKNYTHSEWCLRELHVILEIHGVKVLPVFYKVEPWEVRFPEKGQLAAGFAKLRQRYGADVIKQWRVDLERASTLNGWEYREGDKRLKRDLVNGMVGRIYEWANKPLPLDVGEHVIGVDTVAQEIIDRLDQDKDVLVLGLWGMGGIGKSTIARKLYNCLRTRFATSSFVEDVTDKVMQSGLVKLQNCILMDLCKTELKICAREIKDKSEGKVVLEERLSKKMILVVLDDVCENIGMEFLVSRKMLSHEGSLYIITSRNKRLLQKPKTFDLENEVYVHDVQQLDYKDSRQVFMSFAFEGGFKLAQEFEGLVPCIIRACGGLPLVLKVCGALLKDEDDMEIWRDVLKKLQCGSMMDDQMIFECLRISYDSLEAQHKEMFLDIACALLGQSRDLAIQVWRSQGWFASLGVRSLVEKALVTVDKYGCFNMHDHLRDMGHAIVKKREACEVVTRRLWNPESLKLLRDDETLPKFLQTLVISGASNDKMENSPVHLDLSGLKDLRILRCSFNSMITISIPKNLLWFSWIQGPSSHTGTNIFHIPKGSELVILDHRLYDASCKSIGNASKLEVVYLRWNKRLCCLPNSFGGLKNLRTLDLENSKIQDLPKCIGSLSSLEILNMYECSNLKNLPHSFGELRSLETLNLKNSGITGLPESFGRLRSLKTLDMSFCLELKTLPESFGALKTLRTLILNDSGIEGLPKSFGELALWKSLDMYGCSNLKKLPNSFGAFGTWKALNLRCSGLESLPESFKRFTLLESLDMYGCSNLKKLPHSFGELGSLKTLNLGTSGIERLPESFGWLSSLQVLDMYACPNLKVLPDSFGSLSSLESLNIVQCSHLKKLPDSFGALGALKILNLRLSGIEGLPESFGCLSSLESLNMCECSNLKTLPDSFGSLSSLESLNMVHCSHLKKLPDSFGALGALKILNLRLSGIEGLPESFGCLSSLEGLNMCECSNLKMLPNSFRSLGNLKKLILSDYGIEGLLESFGRSSSLKSLQMNKSSLKGLQK